MGEGDVRVNFDGAGVAPAFRVSSGLDTLPGVIESATVPEDPGEYLIPGEPKDGALPLAFGAGDVKPTVGVGPEVEAKDTPGADVWVPEAVGEEALKPKDEVGVRPNEGVCPTVMAPAKCFKRPQQTTTLSHELCGKVEAEGQRASRKTVALFVSVSLAVQNRF